MDALTTEGYAGKRLAKHVEGLEGLEGWQTAGNALTTEAMCRQTAGCNAGTARADRHRAWWKLPGGSKALNAGKRQG